MWVLMVVGKMVFCCGSWGICWGELIGGFGGVLIGYWVCCCVILGELLLGKGGWCFGRGKCCFLSMVGFG